MFERKHKTRTSVYFYEVRLKCTFNFVMEHPGTFMFQYSEGLQLDTSVQHLQEDEAEETRNTGI